MTVTDHANGETERFRWLERREDDFPYYRGLPVEITPGRWWVVMLAVVAGVAILILPPPFLRGPVGGFAAAILYWLIPLAALAWASRGHWTALFRPFRSKDILIIVGFVVLNYVVTIPMGLLIGLLTETTANPAIGGVAAEEGGRLLTFLRTGIQLFGEELTSILPFLALLYWLAGRRGMGRKPAIVISALLLALFFAVEHLPAYNFNIVQTVLGVGVARIVLLIPYIITKNLWVCVATHILYDWSNFGLAILVATYGT